MHYYRSAPREFERILRSSLPHGVFRNGESAVVSLELSDPGHLGGVDVRSDSPALLSALRSVRWDAAPLPTLPGMSCKIIYLNVHIIGGRPSVGMKVL